jgi:hypothetical protein
VFVVDSQPERLEENVACLDELRGLLADYGRTLEEVPFVVQYNKRDLADDYFMEDLHRKLAPGDAPVFETVATEMTGVLQTLSTISKRVIRSLREQAANAAAAPPPVREAPQSEIDLEPPTMLERPALAAAPDEPLDLAPAPESAAPPGPAEPRAAADPLLAAADLTPNELPSAADSLTPAERMEAAILEEAEHPELADIDSAARQAESLLDTSWQRVTEEVEKNEGVRIGTDLSIVSVGEATRSGERAIRVPLVLGDGDGNTASLALTIQLDPLMDED